MFTGLVEGVGEIVEITRMAEGVRLAIAPPFPVAELVLGESVAVAGACLTVSALTPQVFKVEASPETLARTTLSLKKARDRVNLERALRLGDRLGGHLVTGHVDGLGVLRERREGPASLLLRFELPEPLSPYVIEKGSIAVDGVSLTVNTAPGNGFTVNIIPFTAQKTTLAQLQVGHQVNLETDIIGKYVAKLLGPHSKSGSELTTEFLARHGFL
ncbi:MAG: riboflavin synthase subunit alpha [Deltaproteobacteria bacterium RBG_13_58_19]|nr:MAG: riboflavin synthase subunit alpha [Deltaproteobacteria bacterium RBG_13_58_19]